MRYAYWLLAAALPAMAAAQDLPTPPTELQTLEQPNQGQDQQVQCPASPDAMGTKQKKPSLAKDAGSAAAHTGGAMAGGALGGPIGAAVGGVVVDHVGHAVKRIVKGKEKKQPDTAQPTDCQQQQPIQSTDNPN